MCQLSSFQAEVQPEPERRPTFRPAEGSESSGAQVHMAVHRNVDMEHQEPRRDHRPEQGVLPVLALGRHHQLLRPDGGERPHLCNTNTSHHLLLPHVHRLFRPAEAVLCDVAARR